MADNEQSWVELQEVLEEELGAVLDKYKIHDYTTGASLVPNLAIAININNEEVKVPASNFENKR